MLLFISIFAVKKNYEKEFRKNKTTEK